MEARVERMVHQRMEAEWQRMDEENRLRMEQMFQYMQNIATATSMGTPLPQPPMIFPPPQPPTHTPNQSVASNTQAQDPDLSQRFAGMPPH
uniref:Uncharacterized protein n=1 Tax=Setaria viridis TaxID=4556 RepID=A0A4U6TGA8_SETVI|nr:hypothetical protein SEVIR_8G170800v2 [Setaria viridis]